MSVFENKNRTGNSTSVWLVSPAPTAIPKSFHPVPSVYRAILVNFPSLKKKQESRGKNKRNPKLQPYGAPTHTTRMMRARATGQERGGHSCHVPGHSHPVGGGLPHCALSRPPPSLQDSRWEDWGGGRGGGRSSTEAGQGKVQERERRKRSWEHSACHRVTACLRRRGVLKAVRWSGPSGHIMGWEWGRRFWDPRCATAGATSARRNQAKPKQIPDPPLPIPTNQKPQLEKGDFLFSFQKRPFERNH